MSTIVTRVQRRADMENSSLISTAEWKALISEVYGGEIFEAVTEVSRYFESVHSITATGATSYNEPTDWLKTIRVERVDGVYRQHLIPLMPDERDRFVGTTGDAQRYEHIDDQIYLYPNPSSGTYKMLYQPQAPDLSAYADADLVDVINSAGEALMIWAVAAIGIAKSESNASLALQRAEMWKERMLALVVQESMSEPARRGQPDWTHLEDSPDDYWRSR